MKTNLCALLVVILSLSESIMASANFEWQPSSVQGQFLEPASRPSAPAFPPGINVESLQSRPWNSPQYQSNEVTHTRHKKLLFSSPENELGEQEMVQVENQLKPTEEPFKTVPSTLPAVLPRQSVLDATTQKLDDPTTENSVVKTNIQAITPNVVVPTNNFISESVPIKTNNGLNSDNNNNKVNTPLNGNNNEIVKQYDVHLYDSNLLRSLAFASQMQYNAYRMASVAPMQSAYNNYYSQTMLPYRTSSLPPAYPSLIQQNQQQNLQQAPYHSNAPVFPMPSQDHSGFPLMHPFGSPSQPKTENFGELPQYPPRMVGAIEYESRNAVF